MTETTGADRRLELISTVLLALATVATAWAAYQSRQWTGVQSQGYSKATANRIAENRIAALANRQVQIDVATSFSGSTLESRITLRSPTSTELASEASFSRPSRRGSPRNHSGTHKRPRPRLRCRSTT
jgi:hypothetical protein